MPKSPTNPPIEPSIDQLASWAQCAQDFFSKSNNIAGLPFVHSYPRSSCEVVSALLALTLQRRHKESSIEVAMGYNRTNNEWHFWIEVGNTVVDATAHQFPQFQEPLVTSRPSPLEVNYPDIERLTPAEAIERIQKISPETAETIVCALLKNNTVCSSMPR